MTLLKIYSFLLCLLLLGQPYGNDSNPGPKKPLDNNFALIDSIKSYRFEVEQLQRELSTYKELSLSSMSQNKQNINTFILAVSALIIVIGWFNFQRIQSERKNLEESIRRENKDFLQSEMQKIQATYSEIRNQSESIIKSRDLEKTSLKSEIKNDLNVFKIGALQEIRSQLAEDFEKSQDIFNDFKMDVVKFLLEFRRRSRRLDEVIKIIKKYHDLKTTDLFSSSSFHSELNEELFKALSKMTEIEKKDKESVIEVLALLKEIPDSNKQPTLDLLNLLEEKKDFLDYFGGYDAKKMVIEEKQKELEKLRREREQG